MTHWFYLPLERYPSVQYSTTGDILDTIFDINSCSSLYRTACAVKVDALTNIFLNLVQLRVTREASSRIYVILHMHFWRVLVFLIYIHVLQQAYEIPGYFYHTLKKNRKKIPEKFRLRNGRETLKEKKEQRVYVIASKL